MASALNFDDDETLVPSEEETMVMHSDDHLSNNPSFVGTNGYRNDPENPFYTWLTMDISVKEQSLRHMKNCIMSPFLFGERRNYCKKHLLWLNSLDLIPSPRRSCSSLSDKFIEIADVVEDIVETVSYCLSSEEFLLNSHLICNDLKYCFSVKEALSVGNRSDVVSLISNCFCGENSLDKHKNQLLSLTVLFQALSHVQQACSHGNHYIAKLEEEIKPKGQICMKLRLRGNKHFAAGEFKTAVLFYSRAILLSPFDPLLYGNRAQCYLNLKKLREALSDAKRAVCLKPEWEKGYYRYAQAYFELGYTEKAIAINAVAQKTCSSTLNLLLQAVVFDREASPSSEGSLPMEEPQENIPDTHSIQEQSVSEDCRQHQACSDHPDVRGATAECKRQRLVSSGFTLFLDMEEALSDSVLTDTEGGADNDHKVDEVRDISDSDSLPPLIDISSDDDDDDGDDDGDGLDVDVNLHYSDDLHSDSSVSSLDSMVLSDSDSDDDDMWYLGFAGSDCDLDSLFSDSGHSLSGDDDSDDDDDDDDDDDTESENNEDGGVINEDILRSLLCAQTFLGIPFNPAMFVEIIQGFLREHPEMLNEGSPPALPEVIESLPKVKISKEHVSYSSSCVICRCDYEQEEEVLQLPCAHIFHPPCVITWLRMHATCPTCRDVLPH